MLNTRNHYDPFGKITPNRHGGEDYRFGFNTQEKTDEIAGEGNHTTAKYWEYDPRVVKRWNQDPIQVVGVSPYVIIGNNPVYYTYPNGDYKTWAGALELG